MEEKKKLEVPKWYRVLITMTDNTTYEYDCDDCYWSDDPSCYFVQINDYRHLMFLASNIKFIDKFDLVAKAKTEKGIN